MQIPDLEEKIKERVAQLKRENPAYAIIDEQENKERLEAAEAYAGEKPEHFVEYAIDCRDTSVKEKYDIRKAQKECYAIYKEEEPERFKKKESWQSRVIIPKPFGAVQTAMSAVRKAFSPTFLSIQNETDKEAEYFWQKQMDWQLNEDHANFKLKFTDASGMGFAVGQSLEMIPVWRQESGLGYVLVEPWKIHRDPDALPRDPQSGLYWIHEEYLDKYILKENEKSGKYINIDRACSDITKHPTDENLSKEEIAKRKGHTTQISKFRTAYLTTEFWGRVLDTKGNLLLPKATYTIAGNTLIEAPKNSPFRTLRWPGVSFSPLPDFLAYEGRGILHGIRSLWTFICSLMCLYNDNLNWVVNPMTETNIDMLVDQADIDVYPGKNTLVRTSTNGQQGVRTVERQGHTGDVLSVARYYDELFQSGTFIADALMGQTSKREITAKEAAQHLEQSMGVFGLMGENIETGAIQAIKAGMETVEINVGVEDLLQIYSQEQVRALVDTESDSGLKIPKLTGGFHVSGLSAVMKDNETMRNIREVILPLLNSPLGKYLKPYNIMKAIENRINLRDEDIVVTEDELKQIEQQEQEQQAAMMQQQQQLMQQDAELKNQVHIEKLAKLEKDKVIQDAKLGKMILENKGGRNVIQ